MEKEPKTAQTTHKCSLKQMCYNINKLLYTLCLAMCVCVCTRALSGSILGEANSHTNILDIRRLFAAYK